MPQARYQIRFFRFRPIVNPEDHEAAIPTPEVISEGLSAIDAPDLSLGLGNGERLVAWCDEEGVDFPHMTLGRTRFNRYLPSVESGAERSALQIERDAGLSTAAFCGFFEPDVCVVMSRQGGPTPRHVGRFLRERVPAMASLGLSPIVDSEAIEQLEDVEEITMLSATIATTETGFLREHSASLAELLRAASSEYGAGVVEIALRVSPRSRDEALVPNEAQTLARGLQEAFLEGHDVSRLSVDGRRRPGEARLGEMNLLSHALQRSIDVELEGPEGEERFADLNFQGAYERVLETYGEVEPELANDRYIVV